MDESKATPKEEQELEAELDLAFTPLHKLCLGLAVGSVSAALVALVTLVHLVRAPGEPYPLVLLSQYFWGYEVSWNGIAVGAFWGFFAGSVLGWFFAFARNVVMGITRVAFRARADLEESRGFLDHI